MLAGLIARFGIKFVEYAVIAIVVSGALGGIYGYIHHQGVLAEKAKIEREKTNAINKANKARDHIRARCAVDPANCVPDDWFRD